jgi:hypothetical protein
MANWSYPRQLVELAAFYDRARALPESVSDAEFLKSIRSAFWPTNCWSFVEASFAIIAPGCAMRPHLTRELIQHPIAAMIAGGLENPDDVIAQGVAFATKRDPYVEPTAEGKRWLIEQWPSLKELATAVFNEKWNLLSRDAES